MAKPTSFSSDCLRTHDRAKAFETYHFRPRYALANLGHPSSSYWPLLGTDFAENRLNARHRWTTREFGQKPIADITQILNADLAGKKPIRGQVAQKRKERDSLAQARILCDVLAVRDQVEHLFLLLRRGIEI